MKVEQTECTETLAYKIQMPGNYPEESIQQMQRCVLYFIQTGNQTATIMSLCCLKDHDLTTVTNLTAIRDTGGLEVLVNLLETDDFKCKVKYTVISRLVLSTRQVC